jgi:hypothetical protein
MVKVLDSGYKFFVEVKTNSGRLTKQQRENDKYLRSEKGYDIQVKEKVNPIATIQVWQCIRYCPPVA